MKRQATLGVAVIDDTQFRAATGSGELVRVEGLRKVYHSGSQEIVPTGWSQFFDRTRRDDFGRRSFRRGKEHFAAYPGCAGHSNNGTVYFGASSLESLNEAELAEYRSRTVGFVWQRHHLLPDFTAAENVAMPMLVRGEPMGQALQAAHDWLGEVGLADRAAQRAGELSGGEQQRVAIARALANRPALLLADEPTGDLDERSAESVFDLMKRLHRSHQLTSILATHNLSLARRTDRILVLDHGKLAPAGEVPTASTQKIAWAAGVGAETPGDPNRV